LDPRPNKSPQGTIFLKEAPFFFLNPIMVSPMGQTLEPILGWEEYLQGEYPFFPEIPGNLLNYPVNFPEKMVTNSP